MKSVCVFCGSRLGNHGEYAEIAREMGHLLARRGLRVVYGGGRIGLMGVLADAALAEGGEVIGVIPRMLLDKELGHGQVTELRVVSSMHERKAMMAELADGFIALPGGIGTLEELCEILTWSQLGIHQKPCGLLNTRDYFAGLLSWFSRAIDEGFFSAQQRRILTVAERPDELLTAMSTYQPPSIPRWLDESST